MARLLPNSKVNSRKIDADDAFNRVADRAEGTDIDILESTVGKQRADVRDLTQDPADRPRNEGQ